jgi:hypothetical protein
VSDRGPLARVLFGGALLGVGALAVTGALALRGPGLVGVALATTLAGCMAAGIAREAPAARRRSALESAVWAASWTGGAVLGVAGLAALVGGVVAALVVAGGLGAWLVVTAVRGRGAWRRSGPRADRAAGPTWPVVEVLLLPVRPPREPAPSRPESPIAAAHLLPPVTALTTPALGQEWLRTTAALTGRLDPATRHLLVGRREEVLNELEHRDPDGFARWLAAGPAGSSDPADYVRGGPAQRGPVADTDAA